MVGSIFNSILFIWVFLKISFIYFQFYFPSQRKTAKTTMTEISRDEILSQLVLSLKVREDPYYAILFMTLLVLGDWWKVT